MMRLPWHFDHGTCIPIVGTLSYTISAKTILIGFWTYMVDATAGFAIAVLAGALAIRRQLQRKAVVISALFVAAVTIAMGSEIALAQDPPFEPAWHPAYNSTWDPSSQGFQLFDPDTGQFRGFNTLPNGQQHSDMNWSAAHGGPKNNYIMGHGNRGGVLTILQPDGSAARASKTQAFNILKMLQRSCQGNNVVFMGCSQGLSGRVDLGEGIMRHSSVAQQASELMPGKTVFGARGHINHPSRIETKFSLERMIKSLGAGKVDSLIDSGKIEIRHGVAYYKDDVPTWNSFKNGKITGRHTISQLSDHLVQTGNAPAAGDGTENRAAACPDQRCGRSLVAEKSNAGANAAARRSHGSRLKVGSGFWDAPGLAQSVRHGMLQGLRDRELKAGNARAASIYQEAMDRTQEELDEIDAANKEFSDYVNSWPAAE
jgi:hypothetical protein